MNCKPSMASWVNRDPSGEWGGINLYEPFFNSPILFVDRNGHDNMYNMPAGNNAPPSMTISAPLGGGPVSADYNGGGWGDPFLDMMAGLAAGAGAGAAMDNPYEAAQVAAALANLANQNNAPNTSGCPPNTGPGNNPLIAGLNQIGTSAARGFDVHGFKNDMVGTGNASQFNVSVDSDDGSVWLTPVNAGASPNIQTPYNSLEDVIGAYPTLE
jgi:hypothetical protein